MTVPSEMQSKLRVERHSPRNIGRAQHYEIESYVVHDTRVTAERKGQRREPAADDFRLCL